MGTSGPHSSQIMPAGNTAPLKGWKGVVAPKGGTARAGAPSSWDPARPLRGEAVGVRSPGLAPVTAGWEPAEARTGHLHSSGFLWLMNPFPKAQGETLIKPREFY